MPGDPRLLLLRPASLRVVHRMPVHPRGYPVNRERLLSQIEEYAARREAEGLANTTRATERHAAAANSLMAEIRTALDTGAAAIERVRALCHEYTPDPPSIFRDPAHERGQGFNEGARALADTVLATIDATLNGDDR